jgi:hypothetical protein
MKVAVLEITALLLSPGHSSLLGWGCLLSVLLFLGTVVLWEARLTLGWFSTELVPALALGCGGEGWSQAAKYTFKSLLDAFATH